MFVSNLLQKTFCLLLVLSVTIAHGQTRKVETLVANFPANGALSVDADGNVYVSEYGVYTQTGGNGTRNFKISPSGKVLDSIIGLSGPMGSIKDSKGNFYVNNDNNTQRGIVLKIDTNGKRTNFAEVPGWPSCMAIDRNDHLYITNYNAPEIYKINPQGEKEVYVKDNRLKGSVGVDFDSKGNLIVANFTTAAIFSINKKGEIREIATLKPIVVQGWGIGYLTVVDDQIYVTGIAVNKIYRVSLEGEVFRFAGNGTPKSKDGPLQQASFARPNGIASDKKHKILYISEYGRGGGIRKIQL